MPRKETVGFTETEKGKKKVEEIETKAGETSPIEEFEIVNELEEKTLPEGVSMRVTELESEIKAVKEKYQCILTEDKKYRGTLSKDMHNMSVSLNYAKCRLKCVKTIRRQMENLYNRNLML